MNNFFDKIYLLTINRNSKRLDKILTGYNFEYSIFYGIDGVDLNMQHLIDNKIYENGHIDRMMSIGEIACALSHRAIYEDVILNNHNRVLILEDDAVLIRDLDCNHIDIEYDLLYLGYTPYKHHHGIFKPNLLERTHAYSINNKSAKYLLDKCQIITRPADNLLWSSYSDLDVKAISPIVFDFLKNEESSIWSI